MEFQVSMLGKTMRYMEMDKFQKEESQSEILIYCETPIFITVYSFS